MAEPAKYLFDRSFGPPRASRLESAAERKQREEYDRRVETARREGFEAGRAEGERAARATIEAETAKAAEALADRAQAMQAAMTAECDAMHAHAVQVAVAVAEQLARGLVQAEPKAEVEALFIECLAHVGQAPRIDVRVNDAFTQPIEARLSEIAKARGFEGQLAVTGDASVAVGDCRMEWADGGIARDMEATLQRIRTAIERHLSARNADDRASQAVGSRLESSGDVK